ncbi:HAD family hydrolase [Pseudonocardia broussonetiae]|uniref:HAD family hydrolase n=1 Tax=Pseudonocardia broussonetiae TaxID=2736640 RepID=A0A6M6JP82_9PSEU|nr:HAD family hydrolase [Pseudonocardia broussonetiae]QJY48392.1 HAD family hydrolase [Pseudonocardia broussonetiae]
MIVACLDLDRTVIYSAAALDLRVPDHEAPRLLCVEVYRGVPLSFLTEDGVAAFTALREVAEVVPTTTRTREQLARVHLPGPPPRYAIAANGGHLLVDGVPDPDWAADVRGRLAGCAPLAEVESHLAAVSGTFVLNRRTADDLFAYAVVDRPTLPDGWVDALGAWCAERGWTVSLQGRKVYAVPRALTKSAAAREVCERVGAGTLLAAGDSLLDADLLTAADRAVRPAHGELHDTGFALDTLTVTSASGGAAGAELLGTLRELAVQLSTVQMSAVQSRLPAHGRV